VEENSAGFRGEGPEEMRAEEEEEEEEEEQATATADW